MIFEETILKGSFIIKPWRQDDERGFFARTFCKKEFEAHGLNHTIVQCDLSFNKVRGTFRGMHYQVPPYGEDKLVCCTQGAVQDYIVDLRPDSPTFRQWIAVELTAENRHMLYIPRGFAHGFYTTRHNTQLLYFMTEYYHPEHARGFRWNDPAFALHLPAPVNVIADRDRNYPDIDLSEIIESKELYDLHSIRH